MCIDAPLWSIDIANRLGVLAVRSLLNTTKNNFPIYLTNV